MEATDCFCVSGDLFKVCREWWPGAGHRIAEVYFLMDLNPSEKPTRVRLAGRVIQRQPPEQHLNILLRLIVVASSAGRKPSLS